MRKELTAVVLASIVILVAVSTAYTYNLFIQSEVSGAKPSAQSAPEATLINKTISDLRATLADQNSSGQLGNGFPTYMSSQIALIEAGLGLPQSSVLESESVTLAPSSCAGAATALSQCGHGSAEWTDALNPQAQGVLVVVINGSSGRFGVDVGASSPHAFLYCQETGKLCPVYSLVPPAVKVDQQVSVALSVQNLNNSPASVTVTAILFS